MKDYTEVFVGIDTSKLRNAIAIAEQGRQGEVRYLGEIANTPEATRKLVGKLAQRYGKLHLSMSAIRDAGERIARIEKAIAELAPYWSLAPVAGAVQAMRGFGFIAAVSFLSEVGDLSRFAKPSQVTGYLGLTPSEDSTGDSVRRGGITKAGNSRARRTLIESAWTYRFPARLGADKRAKLEALPKPVADIAWKAQTRLCARYRALTARGKNQAVAVTAIARELAARAKTRPAPDE